MSKETAVSDFYGSEAADFVLNLKRITSYYSHSKRIICVVLLKL